MHSASRIRDELAFDVGRLAHAAGRLEHIDEALRALKGRLEARADVLSGEAVGLQERSALLRVRGAQAHATAHLARRAVLAEVLLSERRFFLVAAMAVSSWVRALRGISGQPVGERGVKIHVEAGRVACRLLRSLRRGRGLKPGVGRMTSGVVVAEFAHPDDVAWVDIEIEHGLYGSRFTRAIHSAEQALAASSAMLREASYVVERMAAKAEPAIAALLAEADRVEDDVARQLSRAR